MRKLIIFMSILFALTVTSFTVEKTDNPVIMETFKLEENVIGFIDPVSGEFKIGHIMETNIIDGNLIYQDLVTLETYTVTDMESMGREFVTCECWECGNLWTTESTGSTGSYACPQCSEGDNAMDYGGAVWDEFCQCYVSPPELGGETGVCNQIFVE